MSDRIEINYALLPALIEQHFKTQQEFADALGMPLSTLSGYLLGKRNPDAKTVRSMAVTLHVPEEVLVMPTDILYYQGQVVAMLRWSVSQIRGEGEIPTHSEADQIARRLEATDRAESSEEEDDGTKVEASPLGGGGGEGAYLAPAEEPVEIPF